MKKGRVDKLTFEIYETRDEMGKASADFVASKIKEYMEEKDIINMMFAAAPSQDDLLKNLVSRNDLDWSRVNAFHLDEYIGLPEEAPQRFSNYLNNHIFDQVDLNNIYYLDDKKFNNPGDKVENYQELLAKNRMDIACIGIGENGHIAFNDPPVADFEDPVSIKIVELEERCRQQQVNDGCFNNIAEVPTQAITVTIPTIMNSRTIICVVPGPTKKEAIKGTLKGLISTECPASILREHDDVTLFLDEDAAEMI
jgi:glucosamine-6-phosphate deaminase